MSAPNSCRSLYLSLALETYGTPEVYAFELCIFVDISLCFCFLTNFKIKNITYYGIDNMPFLSTMLS